MGGLVASDICAVQTLRRGALMHFCNLTAHVFQYKDLSICQLNVCSAVEGSQQGGDIRPDVSLCVVFSVLELEGMSSITLSDERVRILTYG